MLFLGSAISTLDLKGVGQAVSGTIRHLLLVGVLIGYAFLGAGLFYLVERPGQVSRENVAIRRSEQRVIEAVDALRAVVLQNCDETSPTDRTLSHDVMSQSELRCISALKEEIIKNFPEIRPRKYAWNYWEALIYASTVFTTIGYGNLHCLSEMGRGMTILYAIVGIPLTMTVLNNIGKLLYRGLRLLYKGTAKMIIQVWNGVWKRAEQFDNRLSRISTYVEVDVSHSPTNIPVSLAVAIMIVYILSSAAIFYHFETDWDYFTSVYFMFISLSTIGFGDVMPRHQKYMLSACALILVGLALVSMCISVLQAKLERSYKEAYKTFEKGIESFRSVPSYGSTEKTPKSPEEASNPPEEKVHKPEKRRPPASMGVFKSVDRNRLAMEKQREKERVLERQERLASNNSNKDPKEDQDDLEPTSPTPVKWRHHSAGDKKPPKARIYDRHG